MYPDVLHYTAGAKYICAAFTPSPPPSVGRRGKHESVDNVVQDFDLHSHSPSSLSSPFSYLSENPQRSEFNATLRACPLQTPSLSSWTTQFCPRTSISCGTLTAKVATEAAAAAAAPEVAPGLAVAVAGVATLRTDGHAGRPGGGGTSDDTVPSRETGREGKGREEKEGTGGKGARGLSSGAMY